MDKGSIGGVFLAIAGIVLGWIGVATLLLSIILGIAVGHTHTTAPPP